MTSNAHPTFKQALKKNTKRVLEHWAPLGVLLGGIATLLGLYTISAYTNAIGRPDLMAAAFEAKSALVPWLAVIAVLVLAYIFILLGTTILFGLAVSLFNDSSSLQSDLVKVMLLPVISGMAAFLVAIFKYPDFKSLGQAVFCLAVCIAVPSLLMVSKKFRLAVDLCSVAASPSNSRSLPVRIWLVAMTTLLLLGTIVSALFPAMLVVTTYNGEDTPEATNQILAICICSAVIMLLPVLVFYVSKADIFKRVFQCIAVFMLAGIIIIAISPGAPASIVYSAASSIKVRDQSEARFLISESYAKADFEPDIWGDVDVVRDQPLITAFPLFSFGDVLLLCPKRYIATERKNWPAVSGYCVVTKNSRALRMPKKYEAQVNADNAAGAVKP